MLIELERESVLVGVEQSPGRGLRPRIRPYFLLGFLLRFYLQIGLIVDACENGSPGYNLK